MNLILVAVDFIWGPLGLICRSYFVCGFQRNLLCMKIRELLR